MLQHMINRSLDAELMAQLGADMANWAARPISGTCGWPEWKTISWLFTPMADPARCRGGIGRALGRDDLTAAPVACGK